MSTTICYLAKLALKQFIQYNKFRMENSFKYWFKEIGLVLLAAVGIFLVLQFTLMKAEVIGESMEPSLYRGEQIMINKMAYNFGSPQRGDIIVFKPPVQTGTDKNYIKRVIGLPGERIVVEDGQVQVLRADGSSFNLEEPYIAELPLYDYQSKIVPTDEYFVMGDNRNNSSDSRGGWTVPVEDIVGKAWFAFWPLDELGGAPNYSLPQ